MMRMYLVFLLFAIGGTANAVLPPEQFKNLNLATDDDLNPLHGVPWAKGILENHAELMNYDEPLREFILQLFHRTGTFDPSNIKDSFASNATPNGIGILMGEMKKELCLNEETKGITGIKGICKRLSLLRNKEGRYNPLAYRVLSTLLRYKANTRQDYRAYYEGLHAVYPKGVRLPDNWDAWLEEKFLPRDADLPAPPDLKEHYAAYLFWVLKQTSIAPPLEHQGYSISKIGSFPDCGETSLRNFIKLILDKDGRYNLDVLRELGAGPELVAFFTKFNTRQSQQDKKPRESEENEARNAWSNLTGGHKEVRYVPVRNDLNAGADNMLTLLKILLPQLNELTNWAIVFAEIEKIRKKHGLGEFTLQENQLRNEFGELRFQVQGLGCFAWHFQSQHFFIDPMSAQFFGEYPFTDKEEQVYKDVAIFYPGKSLPSDFEKFPWYLYTSLRSNEEIETLIKKTLLPIGVVTGLANRLSTQDARKRVFSKITKKYSTDLLLQLLNDEHLTLYNEYLFPFLYREEYDAARFLATTTRFKEKVGTYLIGHESEVNALALSADGHTLCSGSSDKTIRIWNLRQPEKKPHVLQGHEESVVALALSPDGHTLYSGSRDKTIRIWDLRQPEKAPHVLQGLSGHMALALSPDGHTLYSGGEANTIQIWDLTKLEEKPRLPILKGPDGNFKSLALSPDGHTLYSYSDGQYNKSIQIRDLTKPEKDPRHLLKVNGEPTMLAVSPDGHTLYSANRYHSVQISDLTKPEKEPRLLSKNPSNSVFSLAISPNGKILYTGSDEYNGIRIWDLTKPEQKPHHLQGHNEHIYALAVSPDGRTLYSGSRDETIRVWDLEKELKKPAAAAPIQN